MKIVIDIDNETYGRIQALVNADYFEHDICGYSMKRIANGIPYEERPKGEWIVVSNGTTNHYACSKCGHAGDFQDKFCRECGVDMRVKDELKGAENE